MLGVRPETLKDVAMSPVATTFGVDAAVLPLNRLYVTPPVALAVQLTLMAVEDVAVATRLAGVAGGAMLLVVAPTRADGADEPAAVLATNQK